MDLIGLAALQWWHLAKGRQRLSRQVRVILGRFLALPSHMKDMADRLRNPTIVIDDQEVPGWWSELETLCL